MNTMPPVTKNLLIINILMFAGKYVASNYGVDLDTILGLHFFLSSGFHIYQFITYMFMHAGLEHLFFNMFAVWMFSRIIETTMGQRRFLSYYLTCGIGAGLCQELVQLGAYYYGIHSLALTVGASGAVYGILLAFGMTFPNEPILIFPLPIPIKAKYFVTGYAVIELMSALGRANDGVAHFAHLGGMLFGLLLILYWRNGGGRGSHRNGYYERHYDSGNDSWNFRKWFSSLTRKKPRFSVNTGGKHSQDMAYRKKKMEDEAELDRILDKVRSQGYSGLTEEEKKRLFDFSQKK